MRARLPRSTDRFRVAPVALILTTALLLTACSGNTEDDRARELEDANGPGLSQGSSPDGENNSPDGEHNSGPETASNSTTTTVVATTTTADTSLFYTPLVIDKGQVIVTFDRWFFVLQDPDTKVEVRNADGNLLAEGTVAGPGSIMRETEDHSFELVDRSGKVVAVVSQQELNDAVAAAREAAD